MFSTRLQPAGRRAVPPNAARPDRPPKRSEKEMEETLAALTAEQKMLAEQLAAEKAAKLLMEASLAEMQATLRIY